METEIVISPRQPRNRLGRTVCPECGRVFIDEALVDRNHIAWHVGCWEKLCSGIGLSPEKWWPGTLIVRAQPAPQPEVVETVGRVMS